MIPTVKLAESALPMLTLQLEVAVPTFVSPALTRPTGTFDAITTLVSRLMKVTRAFRISPANGSVAGSPVSAVMSLIVALRVTVAELEVADDVEAKRAPV